MDVKYFCTRKIAQVTGPRGANPDTGPSDYKNHGEGGRVPPAEVQLKK